MNPNTALLKRIVIVVLTLLPLMAAAQVNNRDGINLKLKKLPLARQDSNKVKLIIGLSTDYVAIKKPDSALYHLQQALTLSTKLKWNRGIILSKYKLGQYFFRTGDLPKAEIFLKQATELSFEIADYEYINNAGSSLGNLMDSQKKVVEYLSYMAAIAAKLEKAGRRRELANAYMLIGNYNQNQFNYSASMDYFNKVMEMEKADHKQYLQNYNLLGIASLYYHLHDFKNARSALRRAESVFTKAGDQKALTAVYMFYAICDEEERQFDKAIANYFKMIAIAQKAGITTNISTAENGIAWDYYIIKDYDKAYTHALRAIDFAKNDESSMAYAIGTLGSIYREAPPALVKKAGLKPGGQYAKSIELLTQSQNIGKKYNDFNLYSSSNQELSKTYEKMHRYEDAFKTYKTFITQKDSTDSLTNEKAISLKLAHADFSRKEDSLNYRQNLTNVQLKQRKQQSYFFIGGLIALVILSAFIALSYRNQRKSNTLLSAANAQVTNANHELSEQREEISTQRDTLMDTLTSLKAAQTQLIQAEKMASLGELTAGIAHEIQNPLNFVNNFAEVSVELLAELKEEATAGNTDDVIALAGDLTQNLEKIYHHGKRADSIVKGMLEHSRASTGQKELTDINKLTDEYLRLAYHGLRAKDKTFNADLVTHFHADLPLVKAIPQDVGRVLLNLFNNAFYAVQQRQKSEGTDYKPTITVSTLIKDGIAEVHVTDNGTGIPNGIKDKIMQPFFTTKPTGQGTGLGLSLSYDIIVKGHNGSVSVNSTVGQGSEFVVGLPVG